MDEALYKCHFCDSAEIVNVEKFPKRTIVDYFCPACGHIFLQRACAEDIEGEGFSVSDKSVISIVIRNSFERNEQKRFTEPLSLDDLRNIIKEYCPLNSLEKIDNALLIIDKESSFIGSAISVHYGSDYPYYHCAIPSELRAILVLLSEEEYTKTPSVDTSKYISITVKGYERIRELKYPGRDSRKGFVAMWFNSEMDGVFEDAIKPAIEYIEDGEDEPRFEAIKIDDTEHINDINDEIIAAIRRSRFMVCDLTGYRGGVYFEAGFAKGLGIPVIYTCRKDWIDKDILKDDKGNKVEELLDSKGKNIKVMKEGVHFDLAHMNRIEWEDGKLEEFKDKLEKRIKAVIV